MEPGALIGRYRVDRVLGSGGMGIVVAANHVELPKRAAIKLLRRELLELPEAGERFFREAHAATKLRGEHIGRVEDIGRLPSGEPYIVMELLDGEDLDSMLRRRGPLPVAEVADYLLQACTGLAEAHARGIVHRDLKPANLFVATRPDGSPIVKVLDFGIAKIAIAAQQQGLTQTGATMGSIPYMSPEQLRSTRSVDARADVWSLGASMHHLIANGFPFPFASLADAAVRIWTEEPTPLPAHVPAPLAAAIRGCLVKDVEQRTRDVAVLARQLAPFTTDGSARADRVERILRGVSAGHAVVSPPPATPAPSTVSSSIAVTTTVPAKRSRAGWFVGGAVAAAVIALLAVMVARGEPGAAEADNTWTALDGVRAVLARPITVGELTTWLAARGQPAWPGTSDAPATSVPLATARAVCRDRFGGDVPSEAQWEAAAIRGELREWTSTTDARGRRIVRGPTRDAVCSDAPCADAATTIRGIGFRCAR